MFVVLVGTFYFPQIQNLIQVLVGQVSGMLFQKLLLN